MGILTMPTVAIWKNAWLPKSETFVRDQIDNLKYWDALKIGYFTLPNALLLPDYAPYGSGHLARVGRTVLGTSVFRHGYERHIQQANASLVHAHFGSGGVNSLGLAKRLKLPSITSFHGNDATSYGSGNLLLNRRYLTGLKSLFDYSSVLLPVSKYLADRLVASGAPANKIHVHYTGTIVRPIAEQTGRREGIIFAGRLIEMKGVADLLHAVAALPTQLRGVPVKVVGDGPLLSELRILAKELGVYADFLGWRPHAEVQILMANSLLFCGPSHHVQGRNAEGFGMVYVEAALQGLPVVAYAAGGTQEAVQNGHSGVLTPERDISALSAALADLLKDEVAAAEMGALGRSRAATHFNVVTQTRMLEEIYRDVIRP